jgi:hypothetical protein
MTRHKVLYRYEDSYIPDAFCCRKFRLISHTKCGIWLQEYDSLGDIDAPIWRSSTRKHVFVAASKYEAATLYSSRKYYQERALEDRLYQVKALRRRVIAHIKSIRNKSSCIHYQNIDAGIECTAKNCPCDLYQPKDTYDTDCQLKSQETYDGTN